MTETTQQQHTPGPWVHGVFPTHPHNVIMSARDGKRVAYTVDHELESKPNARLIAAAPDLLAALKDARDVLNTARQYFPKSIRHSDTFELVNTLSNRIAPAIAKAEGGAE